MVARVGLNPSSFSSHSFRRGGASWAFRSHVPGELVKVHGGWKSNTYLKYLRVLIGPEISSGTSNGRRFILGVPFNYVWRVSCDALLPSGAGEIINDSYFCCR